MASTDLCSIPIRMPIPVPPGVPDSQSGGVSPGACALVDTADSGIRNQFAARQKSK